MKNKKLLFVVNVDWFFLSHRLPIAKEALKQGWDVYVTAKNTGRVDEIETNGIKYIDLPISRSGTNLKNEFKILLHLCKIYKSIKPDIVHHITLKPVIYGSIISRIFKIKGTLNAISGLGYNFTGDRKTAIQKVMITLMRFGFKQKNINFIFQNNDDYNQLKALNVFADTNKINFIKGSGVDLDIFKAHPLPNSKRIKI